MSSITINISDVESLRAAMKSLSLALDALSASAPAEVVAEIKKADKPKKVLSPEHLAKLAAGREAAKAKKAAEKAALGEAAPSAPSAPAPPAPSAEKAEKPKKVLSPEHLAKLAAGREAAKAKKAAEKAALGEAAPAPAPPSPSAEKAEKPKKVLSPEHLAKLAAGREAAKAKKAAEKMLNVAASIPLPSSPEPIQVPSLTEEMEEEMEEIEESLEVVSIKGRRFLVDGAGNAYHCQADHQPGDRVGFYIKSSHSIDDSMEKKMK